jgi:hypothetical protein
MPTKELFSDNIDLEDMGWDETVSTRRPFGNFTLSACQHLDYIIDTMERFFTILSQR